MSVASGQTEEGWRGVGRKVSRYCRTCGALAPERGRFCASCGASLNLMSPFPRPPADDRPASAGPPADLIAPAAVVIPSVSGSVRMGFGIALGMLLFFGLVLVAVWVAVGLATSTLTWPFGPQGQQFEGVGPKDSVPIALDGTYRVQWTATPLSPSACTLQASLRSKADAGVDVQLASAISNPSLSPVTGNRTITLAGTDYFLHVESDCSWSIRLVRP